MYEIDHIQDDIQNYIDERIRARLRDIDYRAIFYNQPSNSQDNSTSADQNNVRREGTLRALRRIFKNWRRGSSIRPQLQSET